MGYAEKPAFSMPQDMPQVAVGWLVLVDAPSATKAGNSGSSTAACVCPRWRQLQVQVPLWLFFFFFSGKKSPGNKIDPNSVIKGAFIYFKIYSCQQANTVRIVSTGVPLFYHPTILLIPFLLCFKDSVLCPCYSLIPEFFFPSRCISLEPHQYHVITLFVCLFKKLKPVSNTPQTLLCAHQTCSTLLVCLADCFGACGTATLLFFYSAISSVCLLIGHWHLPFIFIQS